MGFVHQSMAIEMTSCGNATLEASMGPGTYAFNICVLRTVYTKSVQGAKGMTFENRTAFFEIQSSHLSGKPMCLQETSATPEIYGGLTFSSELSARSSVRIRLSVSL